MDRGVRIARWIFTIAAVYGLVAMAPQYFMEERIGRDFPPPITHPEQFYGFVGLALVWQLAFLLIARRPLRFRPFMLVAVLEKLAFGIPGLLLVTAGRSAAPVALFAGIDLVLAVAFLVAHRVTRTERAAAEAAS